MTVWLTKLLILVIAIVLILIIIGLIGLVFFYYNKYKKHKIDFLESKYHKLNETLVQQKNALDEQIIKYKQKMLDLTNQDEKTIKDELIAYYSKQISHRLHDEIKDYHQQLSENKKNIITKILIDSYQNILEESMHLSTSSVVKLEDVNLKGRIIGKDGRNKKIFEYLTGVDLVIDKVSDFITIASLNPIRRTIAINVMNELIKSKNIEPSRIENIFEQETNKFNEEIYNLGKETLNDKLHIYDLNKKIYPYVGRLNYRSSYSQNILTHSLECAYIAQKIAEAIGVDSNKAKLAAFFHDIGKAIDFEIDKNHIDAGVDIAKECELDDYIIEAIKTHHNEGEITFIYSEIAKIADTISASRPGSRIDSYEDYIKRVNKLESICNEFEEIDNAYVIKSGRQLRVMINPKKVENYTQMELLSLRIKDKIEQDNEVGSYKIKVVFIKEDKLFFETSQNQNIPNPN